MSASGPTERPLVVGLGNADRGDDGVGTAVARRVQDVAAGAVDVVLVSDPTDLVGLVDGAATVVVVDAVRTGAPPGTVHVLDLSGGRAFPLRAGRTSTHALGLAAAIELARTLGRLPARLVVVGVEPLRQDVGTPLSGPVAAAVGTAARDVLRAAGIASTDPTVSPA